MFSVLFLFSDHLFLVYHRLYPVCWFQLDFFYGLGIFLLFLYRFLALVFERALFAEKIFLKLEYFKLILAANLYTQSQQNIVKIGYLCSVANQKFDRSNKKQIVHVHPCISFSEVFCVNETLLLSRRARITQRPSLSKYDTIIQILSSSSRSFIVLIIELITFGRNTLLLASDYWVAIEETLLCFQIQYARLYALRGKVCCINMKKCRNQSFSSSRQKIEFLWKISQFYWSKGFSIFVAFSIFSKFKQECTKWLALFKRGR